MSISPNFSNNPVVARIIKSGFQRAGLLRLGGELRPDQAADVRAMLEDRLKELQEKGIILATEERTTLSLLTGVAQYTLDADTIDIDGDGMVINPLTSFNSRTVIQQIPYKDYHHLSDLTIQGIPTQMYVEKALTTTSVLFWPVPNANMTMDYRRIRMLRDLDSDGVNADLWRRGIFYLTCCVAEIACYSGNVPLNKMALVRADLKDAEKALLGDTHEKGDMNFCFDSYRRW